jgi:hypothetical protein
MHLPSGERVFFRQADPNVMNAVLPLLDVEQAAQVLGPSAGIDSSIACPSGSVSAARAMHSLRAWIRSG